ncbi:MAG: acyl-CoA dehydrogenase [Rhodospirillaceae bacterium]|jgi:acyl-CoA dehydrogenase|nr:acyl-CoA dehydrogenase [Rhodospirillaceae bacterium]
MSDSDNIIVDTTTRIFQDLCDPQTVNNAADESWKQPLWDALEESGLTLAWVSDELGGAGVEVTDGFDILRVSGAFASPVPLCETLLAGWLLSRVDVQSPTGAMTVAPQRADDRVSVNADGVLSGTVRQIPFATDTDHIAILAHDGDTPMIALVASSACAITDGESIAGDSQNTVTFDGVTPLDIKPAPDGVDARALYMMGAAARASQMAGALESALQISVAYAQERVAFGRPIGKFQAVQHNLAELGCEAAASAAASSSAADALQTALSDGGAFGQDIFLEVAAAKIRVGEAAGKGAAIAHQAHGAIGFTKEHILNRFTRRLWAWRDDFGGESAWAVELGAMIAENGADELWPLLASR